jgi:hypothetical protein
MENEDRKFDAPIDPVELKARLFGVVASTETGEEWYWDDSTPMPECPVGPPKSEQLAPDAPRAEQK